MQEYNLTPKVYLAKLDNGQSFKSSERLFIGRSFCQSMDRRRNLPVVVLNLDGVIGSWDSVQELYILRQKFLETITTLSFDFNVVAVSRYPKYLIRRVVE